MHININNQFINNYNCSIKHEKANFSRTPIQNIFAKMFAIIPKGCTFASLCRTITEQKKCKKRSKT